MKRLGLLLLITLTACDKPVDPPPPPRPALVMIVGATAAATGMTLVGEVRPRYESAQGFRIKGKIIERKVEMGSHVKKGQLIARLDAADTHLSTAAAQADVRAAEASYALALTEINRQRQLFAQKFISASALDAHEAELKTANAKLAQVKAQANVTANQTQYTQLTADRDGVVTMIHAEPGQVVDQGEAIVKIADTHAIDVLVAVPESRMADVKLNATVIVRLWADRAKAYTGIVREVSPAADSATRAFNVRVTLKDADAAIKLGMTAGVKFNPQDEQSSAELLIPNSALTEINGQKTVWVIDANDKAQPRKVNTGQYREDGVLVVSGLQAGEKIAIAGAHTLVKDQIVKPVVEAAP